MHGNRGTPSFRWAPGSQARGNVSAGDLSWPALRSGREPAFWHAKKILAKFSSFQNESSGPPDSSGARADVSELRRQDFV